MVRDFIRAFTPNFLEVLARRSFCFKHVKKICTMKVGRIGLIWVKYSFEKGPAVAQLVEALCYKPEGRGFDSQWCYWIFSLT
jgi:hypothetical protein